MSSNIQFSLKNYEIFELKNFGFNELKQAVNGDCNIGELRFNKSDGQIHRINSHSFWTCANHKITSIAENAITRNAVLKLLEGQFGYDANIAGVFNEIKERLIGDANLCKPISRDEVRFMINLLESESIVGQSNKDLVLTSEQVRAKLDLSQHLKTCSSAVRNAWANLHGDEIKDYIKGWGKSKALNTVSDNVRAHNTSIGKEDYAPTEVAPIRKQGNPPPIAPANPEVEGSENVVLSSDIQSRLETRTQVETYKTTLKGSIAKQLEKVNVEEMLNETSIVKSLIAMAGEKLSVALEKINNIAKTNETLAEALKKQLKKLPFYDATKDNNCNEDALRHFLAQSITRIVKLKMERALDRLFSQCVSSSDFESIKQRHASFLSNLVTGNPTALVSNILYFSENELPDRFSENIFGREDLLNAHVSMFSSMETWVNAFTGMEADQLEKLIDKEGEFVPQRVMPLEHFMAFNAAKIEPLLAPANMDKESVSRNIATVSDTLQNGTREISNNVGLNILGKLKPADKLMADTAMIILGRDDALQLIISRFKRTNPKSALILLKSLINAHHVVRPRKKVLRTGENSYHYDYCRTPEGIIPLKAIQQARKILATSNVNHVETFATEQENDFTYDNLSSLKELPTDGPDDKSLLKQHANAITNDIQGFIQRKSNLGTGLDKNRRDMGNEIMRMVIRFTGNQDILTMSPEEEEARLKELATDWSNRPNNNILGNIG